MCGVTKMDRIRNEIIRGTTKEGVSKECKNACGGDEEETKTEAGVDGHCECGLEGEETVGQGDTKPGRLKATC